MTCRACARAITGGAEYRNGCHGCQARALARCQAMLDVMNESLPEADRAAARAELRAAIGRAMPGVAYTDARVMVHQWWRVDCANRGEPA